MSETTRIGPRSAAWVWRTRTYNDGDYPVEVTVRRVTETVRFEAELDGYADDGNGAKALYVPQISEVEALRGRGYVRGQRVRVTIEPLD